MVASGEKITLSASVLASLEIQLSARSRLSRSEAEYAAGAKGIYPRRFGQKGARQFGCLEFSEG